MNQVEEISTIQATPMQQVADLSSNPYFQPQNTANYGNNLKHIQIDLKTKLIQNYNQIKNKLQHTQLCYKPIIPNSKSAAYTQA